MSSEAILAYRAGGSIEARSLAAYLDSMGIGARITGEPLETAYPGLHLSTVQPVEVWISSDDSDEAAPLIAAWQTEYRPDMLTDGKEQPQRFKFSLLTLLLVMAALAWLLTSMTLGSDLGSALTSLLMAFLLIVSILAYRRMRSRRAVVDHDNQKAEPWDSSGIES